MASRKRGGGGAGMGGAKNAIKTGLVFLLLISAVVGWAKVNNINSIPAVYNYFKSWSDHAWSCGAGEVEWNCDSSLNPGEGTSPTFSVPSDGSNSEPGNSANPGTSPVNSEQPKTELLKALDTIAVSEEQAVDYERSEWKHWVGNPCDTRENVLYAQGQNPTKDPSNCKVLSGSWVDPYSGETFTNASDLDIDHVIPLSYAARHGGQAWSPEMKEKFANDSSQLLAVSAKENRGKSDKGPEDYMPPNKNFQCEYSKRWVSTASQYGISVTEGDRLALKAGLQKCSQ